MRTVREQYWRYSLFILILGLGITAFVYLLPFLGGLLGAVTIYILLRNQMWYLSEQRHWRRSVAAALLSVEAVCLFLLPLSLVVWLVVDKLQHVALDPQLLITPLKNTAALIYARTGYDVWQESNLSALIGSIPRLGQLIVGGIIHFAVNIVVLLFVLYFMLIGGCRMETYCREILPFDRVVGHCIMGEIYKIVRSNAIGIPLLAIFQGIVAYGGYLVFGVDDALFWGIVTCMATIIPIIGTALVWLPLAAYSALTGDWGAAVGLVLYGALVVTNIDNLIRFLLQKRIADTHPLVTVFGVFIGLPLFGFIGVIFGPLLLAILIFCVDLFKRKYLDGRPYHSLFVPDNTHHTGTAAPTTSSNDKAPD